MAGKNAINKPKIKMAASAHAKALGRKRAARSRANPATRSSTTRYADKATTAPRPTDSQALALYSGETPAPLNVMTKTTLSKKRAKKIARNQKYFASNVKSKSSGKGNDDVSMDIETETAEQVETKLEKTKKALWSVIENHAKTGYPQPTDTEGTTLGIQAF